MLFIPQKLPTSTKFDLNYIFNPSSTPEQVLQKAQYIVSLRNKFYQKIQFISASSKPLQTAQSLQQMKAYLYETYNLLSLLSKSTYNTTPVYHSIFSSNYSTFEMPENGEVCGTAEIIFSKYFQNSKLL